MRIFKKILFWLTAVFLILFILLQFDDAQSPESIRWNQEVHEWTKKENEAYYLQLGLFASEDKDPIEFGKHRLEEAEKVYGDYRTFLDEDNFPITFNDPIAENNLGFKLPKNFCSLDKQNCVDSIKSNQEMYLELLNSNQVLLDRYQKFLALDDYHEMTSPNTTLYFGDYQQIISSNKLWQLYLLINSGELEHDVLQLLALTRKKLAQSNTLIGKMVYLAVVQLNLDFYNQLLKESLIVGKNPIPNTTDEELSLEDTIKSEHAVATTQIKLLNEAANNDFWAPLKTLWVTAFYKKNMSVNSDFQGKQNWLAFSMLSAKEQALQEKIQRTPLTFLDKARNYSGWWFGVVSATAFSDYSLRLHNLQTKINLINWYQKNRNPKVNDIDLSKMPELNNFSIGNAYIDKQDSLLCLPVPIKHRKNHHCISI